MVSYVNMTMNMSVILELPHYMGGSRIFDCGGPRIDEARDAGQNVAIFALKSWPIGGHMALWPPLEPPLATFTLPRSLVPISRLK